MRLSWDDIGVRRFKAGLDRGVLYPLYDDGYADGVPWNGLTGVDDGNSGHESTILYTNDRRSAILFTPYEHGGTIRCYTYPDQFDQCIGNFEVAPGLYATAQEQVPFGLCYRVKIGNDVLGLNYAYELHIIYNAYVSEATCDAATTSTDPTAQELSFTYESIDEEAVNHDPTAHLIVNSRFTSEEGMSAIERILYGDDEHEPRLILPDELYEICYRTQPIPDEYKYYPHDFRYPEDDVYPLITDNA